MDLNLNIDLVQSQKLILTPQLKQAITILSMNSQELFEYVEEQLEENPVLEVFEGDDHWNDSVMVDAGFFEWDGTSGEYPDGKYAPDDTDEAVTGITDKRIYKLTLKEHLYFQLCTSDLPKKFYPLAEYMISAVSDSGYLEINLKQTARIYNIPRSDAENVLKVLQTFDPPGICARNLKECLLIQIKAIGKYKEYIGTIVDFYLDKMSEGDFFSVSEALDIKIEKVEEAFNLLKKLEPKPGRAFYRNDGIKFIIPDIIVRKEKNSFEVYINEDAIPLVNINRYYRNLLYGDITAETRKFIQNRLDSAAWLISCIEKRKDVMLKLVRSLIERQREFFEKGRKFLKPLEVDSVADDVGVHQSIIARSLAGKYIQCPWGIFEARYFFG